MSKIQASADVAPSADIGRGSQVWHLAQIRERAVIGENCIIGRGAYVGAGVKVGDNCKIQNHALIYEPASLSDGVFIGPGVILTNDRTPRAITPEGDLKAASDWVPVGVDVLEGAAIGAGAICVAPVTVGKWAMIGAGSVVTNDVPNHALVVGIPARQIGWVGEHGARLQPISSTLFECPVSKTRFDLNLKTNVLTRQ